MPSRRSDIAGMAVRALIGGMLTCCMTASIAGRFDWFRDGKRAARLRFECDPCLNFWLV